MGRAAQWVCYLCFGDMWIMDGIVPKFCCHCGKELRASKDDVDSSAKLWN